MQNILFGDIEVIDTRTSLVEKVKNKVFLESDPISDNELKNYILKDKQPKERAYFKFNRKCSESAKVIGVTNH